LHRSCEIGHRIVQIDRQKERKKEGRKEGRKKKEINKERKKERKEREKERKKERKRGVNNSRAVQHCLGRPLMLPCDLYSKLSCTCFGFADLYFWLDTAARFAAPHLVSPICAVANGANSWLTASAFVQIDRKVR
jgi:hypothetical protein